MAERSPFPSRTPITTTDGRASLPFSRWLLNEFGALSEIRERAVTSEAAVTVVTYPQAVSGLAPPSASYASEAETSDPASYPVEGSIPLPFGEY